MEIALILLAVVIMAGIAAFVITAVDKPKATEQDEHSHIWGRIVEADREARQDHESLKDAGYVWDPVNAMWILPKRTKPAVPPESLAT